MTTETTEKTSSQKVAETVCEQLGHRLGQLGSTATQSGSPVMCMACGMTLDEIRQVPTKSGAAKVIPLGA